MWNMKLLLRISLSLCLILQGLSGPISKHTIGGTKATDDEVKDLENELRKQAGEGKKEDTSEEEPSGPVAQTAEQRASDKRIHPNQQESIDEALNTIKEHPQIIKSLVKDNSEPSSDSDQTSREVHFHNSDLKIERARIVPDKDESEEEDDSDEHEEIIRNDGLLPNDDDEDDDDDDSDELVQYKKEDENLEELPQGIGAINAHKYHVDAENEENAIFRHQDEDYKDENGEINPGKGYFERLWQKRMQKRIFDRPM
ncbi:uncharacterized protein LOC141908330 isoform X1 [Tubulanus polymorphus]|uniref:uncharacterized protein LOC141908330 isoform X1 n=1 Tax=Tubulanus polymorphus TaxID=672921 RepID=UPI003DA348FB